MGEAHEEFHPNAFEDDDDNDNEDDDADSGVSAVAAAMVDDLTADSASAAPDSKGASSYTLPPYSEDTRPPTGSVSTAAPLPPLSRDRSFSGLGGLRGAFSGGGKPARAASAAPSKLSLQPPDPPSVRDRARAWPASASADGAEQIIQKAARPARPGKDPTLDMRSEH